MNRVPVASSNVNSIGYDYNSKILEVQFNSGSIYHYFNVPTEIYNGLMCATSKGIYLNRYIKGKYVYKQIV